MKNINSSFICCQIGAREHYIIPRILFEKNLLRHLYTDIWLNPKQIISKLAYRFTSRLSGRHDKFLADSNNTDSTRLAARGQGQKRTAAARDWC